MSYPIDRFDAECFADFLGVPVEVVPEDTDTLTRALWDQMLPDEPVPESVEVRWEFIVPAFIGRLGFGGLV